MSLGVAGVTAYGFLVVSARTLGKEEYAPLSVLWALTLLAGPGFFLPVEQEIAKALAARRARGEGGGPVVRRAAALAVALLTGLVLVGLALGQLLTDRLFSGKWVLLVAWLVSMAAGCAAHLSRGVLSGLGRFRSYAHIIGGESAVRFVLAALLSVVGVSVAGPYGLAMAIGPLVAVGVALRGQTGLLEPGPPAPWSEITSALAWLLFGSVVSVGLMNAGPIAMELLAGARQEDEAGRFLAGLVIARIPLFLFQAVQASLLPRLSQLASEGRADEFRVGLARLVGLVAGIAALGALVAFVAGPSVVHLLFGGDFRLPHRTMGLLGLGSGTFMVASLLAQASIALDGHRLMALAWGVGIVTLTVAMATSSSDLFLRVELGGVAGGVGALLAQAAVLRLLLRSGVPIESGNLIEAIHDVTLEP